MRRRVACAKPVNAATDASDRFDYLEDASNVSDAVDKASDAVEDMEEAVSNLSDTPEDTILNIENNIENHYIAECKRCHEVFISAVVESESDVDAVNGECPCCHEETEQELKWIVRNKSFSQER